MTRTKPTSLKAALDRIKTLEAYLAEDRQTVKDVERERDALWGRLKVSELHLSQANTKIQSLQADMVKSKRNGLLTAKSTGELIGHLGQEMQRYANTGLAAMDLVSESHSEIQSAKIQSAVSAQPAGKPHEMHMQWVQVDPDGKDLSRVAKAT